MNRLKDLIVACGATHRAGLLDEYQSQLSEADIPLHIEPLDALPLGANSINMARRIAFIRRVCGRLADYQKIVITDAWDVLFYGTREEVAFKVPDTLIVSAERNCYPEPGLATLITGETPWKYCNNGMMAGTPSYLLSWCAQAESTPHLDILDQAWFNRRRAEGSPLTPLDESTNLFYVVSSTLENGELVKGFERPLNQLCKTYPCFFHFSGGCPTDRFRSIMQS